MAHSRSSSWVPGSFSFLSDLGGFRKCTRVRPEHRMAGESARSLTWTALQVTLLRSRGRTPLRSGPPLKLLRILLTCLLGHAVTAAVAFGQAPKQGPGPGEVNLAIDRGVAWLLESQHLDGSWDYNGDPRPGHTALVAYTLIKSGLSHEHHAVRRVMVHLEGEYPDKTYDVALMILALSAHDPKAHEQRIQDLVDQLLEWPVPGGFGYPGGAGDLSNTQYAALGLWAASKAGARVPQRAWFELIQATLGYRTPGGGFAYRQGDDRATGSMTAAGVAVLAICGDRLGLSSRVSDRRRAKKVDDGIAGGLEWMADNFSVQENPKVGRGHLAYYLYGLERVGALVGVDRIGDHDWYAEGASFLVRGQSAAGHWARSVGGGTVQACFALLFLRRATAPVTGGLHRSGGRRYDQQDAEADVRIAASGENPIGMWLAGFGREASARLEWEGDKGRGPRVVRVVWLVDQVEVARLAGDEQRAGGDERFAHQAEFSEPGTHLIQAEVHVLRPPYSDSSGRTYPATLKILGSASIEVEVVNACAAWMLDNARDRSRNLMPLALPQVSASSTRAGNRAQQAVDQHQSRAWIANAADARPSLNIQLRTPQEANVILVGHARSTPEDPGRWARALEVEVYVNGVKHRLRMHSDERRKGRLVLPKPVRIRELKLVLPLSAPGRGGERSVGLAEVELQLQRSLSKSERR